jgi:2-succinyl-6-hydroxy-2,4-cyclohexadiene-1-carboxylate synthase
MSPERLFATHRGAGSAVVLVHGFTQTGASWAPVADALVLAGHMVVTVDAPGHGRSAAVDIDVAGGAELLMAAAADTAGASRAAYAGYSMGGRLCLELALRHPDVVDRLVLISTAAGIEDPAERRRRRRADEALARELDEGGDARLPAFIDRWLAGPLFAGLSPAAAGREQRLTNTASGLATSLRSAGTATTAPLWDRLSELPMPVLIVVGSRDAKFTAAGRRMADAIGANAHLVAVADAGHAVHLEAPERVGRAIIEFLG